MRWWRRWERTTSFGARTTHTPDCVWPDSRSVIDENLGHLDEDKLKKIVCDNTAKLYGFPN